MLLRKNFASDEEAVEYLSRRRARVLPALVFMFLLLQVNLGKKLAETGRLDPEQAAAWLLMSAGMLALVSGAGLEGLFRPGWRIYLNDELSCMHRLKAQALGFWSAMLAAIGLLALEAWVRLSALQVIHLLITIGIAAAVLRYAILERRAFKP